MALDKRLFGIAFAITAILLLVVFAVSTVFGEKREDRIQYMVQDMYNSLNEMQTFILMSEIYGDEMACLAFKSKLRKLDESIWELGIKIDQYRVASEEFQKSPFYLEQKKVFNENQVFYLMLLTKVKELCNLDQESITFFYKNSKECKKCDDQSFVLSDVKRDGQDQVSIFSFDADLNLTTVNLLTTYYEIDEYPCLIVNEKKMCGIQSRDAIIQELCKNMTGALCS